MKTPVYKGQGMLLVPCEDMSSYRIVTTRRLRFTPFRMAGLVWKDYKIHRVKKLPQEGRKSNPLAYTHVIRHDSTGNLYKYSAVDFKFPEGYTVVYKAQPGYLLPSKFKEELDFHADTDSN